MKKIFLAVLLPLWLACSTGTVQVPEPRVQVPKLNNAQEFYMLFHSTDDSLQHITYIEAYPTLARQSFYQHIVKMVTDRTYKEASPHEYDRAYFLGERLAVLYNIKFHDRSLLEVYQRIEPIEED